MHNTSIESSEDFSVLLQDLTDVVREIASIEHKKAQAVSLYQHRHLDACIRQEQASLLRLKGLEAKRMDYMKKHGWEGLTLRQLTARFSSVDSEKLTPYVEELLRAVEELSRARQSAERILNIRIENFEKFIKQESMGSKKEQEGTRTHIRDKYI